MNIKNKIFLFPLALAVIFFCSIIIIFSPLGSKTIVKVPQTAIFCGGIANLPCPTGYQCQLSGDYPDAGGVCLQQ